MTFYHPSKAEAQAAGHKYESHWNVHVTLEPYNGWMISLSPKTNEVLNWPLADLLKVARLDLRPVVVLPPEHKRPPPRTGAATPAKAPPAAPPPPPPPPPPAPPPLPPRTGPAGPPPGMVLPPPPPPPPPVRNQS